MQGKELDSEAGAWESVVAKLEERWRYGRYLSISAIVGHPRSRFFWASARRYFIAKNQQEKIFKYLIIKVI